MGAICSADDEHLDEFEKSIPESEDDERSRYFVSSVMVRDKASIYLALKKSRKAAKFLVDVDSCLYSLGCDPLCFRFLTSEFKKDKTVVSKAIEGNPTNCRYLDDRNTIFHVMSLNSGYFPYLSEEFRRDKSLISQLVIDIPEIARFFGDKESCVCAVQSQGSSFPHLPVSFQRDKDVIFEYVKKYPNELLKFENLRRDKYFIINLILSKDEDDHHGIWRQERDEEFNVKKRHCVLISQESLLPDQVKNDRDVIIAALTGGHSWKEFPKKSFEDVKVVHTALKVGHWTGFTLEDVKPEMFQFKEIAIFVINNGTIPEVDIKMFPNALLFEKEVFLAALMKDYPIELLPMLIMMKDRDIVERAVNKDPALLEYASEEVRKDFNVCQQAFFGDKSRKGKDSKIRHLVLNEEVLSWITT